MNETADKIVMRALAEKFAGGPSRCAVGAGLWADYQAAGTPPHFMWLRPKQEATA